MGQAARDTLTIALGAAVVFFSSLSVAWGLGAFAHALAWAAVAGWDLMGTALR